MVIFLLSNGIIHISNSSSKSLLSLLISRNTHTHTHTEYMPALLIFLHPQSLNFIFNCTNIFLNFTLIALGSNTFKPQHKLCCYPKSNLCTSCELCTCLNLDKVLIIAVSKPLSTIADSRPHH